MPVIQLENCCECSGEPPCVAYNWSATVEGFGITAGFPGYSSPALIPIRVYQKKIVRIGGWRGSCDTGRAEWQETIYWVHATVGDIYKITITDNINGLTYSYEMADNGDVTEDTFPPDDPIDPGSWFEPFTIPACGQAHTPSSSETTNNDDWTFTCHLEDPLCGLNTQEACDCEERYWINTFSHTTLEDVAFVETAYDKAVLAKEQVNLVGNHSQLTEDIITFADTTLDTDLGPGFSRAFRVSKVRSPDGLRYVVQATGTYPAEQLVIASALDEAIVGALHAPTSPSEYWVGHASKIKVASRVEVTGEPVTDQIFVRKSQYFDYIDIPNHNYNQPTRHSEVITDVIPAIVVFDYLLVGGEPTVGHSCTGEVHPCFGLYYFDGADAPKYGSVYVQAACGVLGESPPPALPRVGGPKKVGPRRTGPG